MTQADGTAPRTRRPGAVVLALALISAGVALTYLGIEARAAAEPPGMASALLTAETPYEVRGALLLSVGDAAARVGVQQRAVGGALACAGAALLALLAMRRGRPAVERALGGALALAALAAAVALAFATGAGAGSAREAFDAAMVFAPAAVVSALLAAARAA